MNDTLLRADPSELRVRHHKLPRFAHVGEQRLDFAAEKELFDDRSDGLTADLVTLADGEGHTEAAQRRIFLDRCIDGLALAPTIRDDLGAVLGTCVENEVGSRVVTGCRKKMRCQQAVSSDRASGRISLSLTLVHGIGAVTGERCWKAHIVDRVRRHDQW